MIHSPLIAPEMNWVALKLIESCHVQDSINDVLVAAESTEWGGTKLLMRDLTNTHKYLQLEALGNLPALWRSFCVFVDCTLLKLADIGVVHSDILPGADITANIMYNEASTSMALVDLDSLAKFSKLQSIGGAKNYLNGTGLNAQSYVWWQCFVIAVMWKRERRQTEGCSSLQMSFSVKFDTRACTSGEVTKLLETITESDWFDDDKYLDDDLQIRLILIKPCQQHNDTIYKTN